MHSEIPTTADACAAWQRDLRLYLWQLLGDLPAAFTPHVSTLDRRERDGCLVEKLVFDNGAGAQVFGYLLMPPDLQAKAPAVLYHHVHGNKYWLGKDELFFPDLVSGVVPGPALVARGYVVLAIDAYCFGERQNQGPAGEAETGAATEQALFKHFLWHGSTLWGMMIRDDLLALNFLLSRPEVEPTRIAATGMSLGGSRTTWLGALDERLRLLIPVAQMTRYRDFAATGHYNHHSIYYYIPSILKTGIDMEHLVALAAPRPQCIVIGDSDPLSPVKGIHTIVEFARSIYQLYRSSDQFSAHIYEGVGHQYTPEMFSTMVNRLNQPWDVQR